ncbi:MAG: polysaccharide deacetylase family protein [Defluviitaleaceae bacterium]|nr:polysaccharide deacetylase family protein [Defluviitaleaceae bacterium]
MYRSKKAERKYFFGWVKIAAVFSALALALIGGIVVMGQNRNDERNERNERIEATETIPAILPIVEYAENATYINAIPYTPEIPTVCDEPTIPDKCYYYAPEEFYRAPRIALTFDDGPVWLTAYLLDILDEHEARVTFCVIGDLVEIGADTVIRAFEAGHEIVGHSWNHRNLSHASIDEITMQITKTSEIIYEITGEKPPPLFRVPFGTFNRRIHQAAYAAGYGILNWSLDPQDWRYRDEEHIYDYIMYHARDGAIVVLHDVHETTIYAMARIIPALICRGFELVTASEIIYYVYGGIEPGFEFTGTRK